VCAALILLWWKLLPAQTYTWTTLAGSSGYGEADGFASSARFFNPTGVAVDASNNVYVADFGNNTIRKITPSVIVSTLAGLAGVSGTNDGTGSAARFNQPSGLAVDKSNNVFVADSTNHTIRKISSSGMVTTLAGTPGVAGTNDGTGGSALFYYPSGLTLDSSNNLFVADTLNYTIRKITPSGVVSTFAGLAGFYGTNDGTGISPSGRLRPAEWSPPSQGWGA
jgi:hypothetical protein